MERPQSISPATLKKLHAEAADPVIHQAWQKGLAELDPTPSELERGLELHGRFVALDHFGFLPDIFTPQVGRAWQELLDANLGGREFHFELSLLRKQVSVDSSEGREAFCQGLAASGLSGIIQTTAEGKTLDEDLKRLASFRRLTAKLHPRLNWVGEVGELPETLERGSFFFIGSVNGPPLTGALRDPREEFQWLEVWRNLGVRLMHLAYNRRNAAADGCAEPANAGLSELGRELISRMNALGLIVDVSHTGDQSSLEACQASAKPLVASHSGRKQFHPHMRNKSDPVLKAIAETGGLIGVVSLPSLLGRNGDLTTLLDAVRDLAGLVGTDHIAISTDYAHKKGDPGGRYRHGSLPEAEFTPGWWGNTKPGTSPVKSQEHFGGSLAWTNWPLFTVGLVQRGFTERDIEKILSDNFLRILRASD